MIRKILLLVGIISIYSTQINAQAFQWAKQLASVHSYGIEVVADNNLNVISAGWFQDSVDLDPGPGTNWVYENISNAFSFPHRANSYLSKLDQNGVMIWGFAFQTTTSDSINHRRINSIDVDNQGNILVVGHFRDSIDLDFGIGVYKLYSPHNATAISNVFIAKYDPNGVLVWGKSISCTTATGNGLLWGECIKVDGSGNVLVSGRFKDTVDFDPAPGVYNLIGKPVNTPNNYTKGKFLLKLTSSGNFAWARDWSHTPTYLSTVSWYGKNQLAVDANDNIFLPLIFQDSVDMDPMAPIDIVHSSGYDDVSLLKISPGGSLVWHKEISSPYKVGCNMLAADPSGNIFYTLNLNNTIPVDVDPGPSVFMMSGTTNSWVEVILKLDNNGDFVWAVDNSFSVSNNGWYGASMATDTAGGLYLTTQKHNTWIGNSVDLDPGPNSYMVSTYGFWDITFQKFDASGNFVFGGLLGGADRDWNADICTDHARGVYLTGQFVQQADFDPSPDSAFMTSTLNGVNAYIVKLINCSWSDTTVYQSCDSVVYNNQVFYNDTLIQINNSLNGCDTVHAIIIDVKTSSRDTIFVDTCKQYVWNNITYLNSGFYYDTLMNSLGCDSLVVLDLTLYFDTVQIVNLSDCDSTTFNGITYYQTGQYQQQYTSVHGCDSNYLINFTNNTADTSVTINGAVSLMANAISATYQWIDCNTMQIISGATNAVFNAPQSGSYACIVSQNNCIDTSSCYQITFVPDVVKDYSLVTKLYPNPSKGTYHLELDKNYKNVALEIRDRKGQLIWKNKFVNLKNTDLRMNEPSGVYLLYIKIGERQEMKKLLKW